MSHLYNSNTSLSLSILRVPTFFLSSGTSCTMTWISFLVLSCIRGSGGRSTARHTDTASTCRSTCVVWGGFSGTHFPGKGSCRRSQECGCRNSQQTCNVRTDETGRSLRPSYFLNFQFSFLKFLWIPIWPLKLLKFVLASQSGSTRHGSTGQDKGSI